MPARHRSRSGEFPILRNSGVRICPHSGLRKPDFGNRKPELGSGRERSELSSPIIVCPIEKRNQLIAGERRLRAARDYIEMETIEAQIVVANDLQARRISAAENLQREDLSAIEAIEAIVEIVDAELIGDKEYTHLSKTYLWERGIKTS